MRPMHRMERDEMKEENIKGQKPRINKNEKKKKYKRTLDALFHSLLN